MLMLEINMIEQKIALLEATTTVTDVPESESLKTKAIPKQTALGKETTNPLKAEVLLKNLTKDNTDPNSLSKTSKLVNSSPHTTGSSKMTILSPNNLVQEFTPDYLKAVKQKPKSYYVIYKGPHTGIHTEWGITKTFIDADKVTCKKFKSEESARISLATYSQEGLDDKPVLLRPKIQRIKEEHRDQRFKIPEDKEQVIFKPPMKFEDFRIIWNKARAACPEDLIHEKFFTTDKVTKSLYNFVEGADPKLVQQAFEAGLINNIYPSHNLQELRHFPQPMVDSIKNFRKKVLKAKDDPIYIKVISSIPDWQQEDGFNSYHFLEIGLAKSKKEISQSQPIEEQQSFPDNLVKIRVNSLRRISEKVLEVLSGTKKKVNYVNDNCIITSWSFSNTNEEDIQRISQFGEKFMKNSIQAGSTTRQSLCRHLKQLFEDHYCQYCIDNNTTESDPSTEEESSTN